MKVLFTLTVAVMALAGCAPSPIESTARLAGTWSTGPVPSGGAVILTLRAAGVSISGEAHDFGVEGVGGDSATIVGRYADGVYTLQLAYMSSGSATFTGRLVGDTLAGPWSPPWPSGGENLRFVRQ